MLQSAPVSKTGLNGGVKDLVDVGVQELPLEYVQAYDIESSKSQEAQVPLIDISCFSTGDKQKQAIVMKEIDNACQQWGLFQLTGHGIPEELMQQMVCLMTTFFDLPLEKRISFYSEDKVRTFKAGSSHNSTTEKTNHWHDYMYQLCDPPPRKEDMPTMLLPNYLRVTSEYSNQVQKLMKMLLAIFSECLGLTPEALEREIGKQRQTMRMNYYPPCPDPARAIGLGQHSDVGIFTVLQQDNVEGLQVLHDGHWIGVNSNVDGALLVIVGDQLQILTNGRYISPEHRAIVNTSNTRTCIVSFFLPPFEKVIAPMQELLDGGPPLYKSVLFQDYYDQYFAYLYSKQRMLEAVKL